MKKIVILGTAYPFRGGLAAFNERLAQELINLGHSVEIITFTVQYPKILFPGKSQMSEDRPPDLDIKRWVHAFNPFNWYLAGKKVKALKADIIVCKFWLPVMAPCLGTILRLAKSGSTKVVSILDNVIPHEHRPGDHLFIKYFVSAVDQFIYMSHQVGNDLKLFDQTKPARFIPHPIYDNYGDPVSKQESIRYLKLDPSLQYVLFFGFIRNYKGLDLLYQAIELLGSELPQVRFIIAGEFYTDPGPYESMVKDLGIADRLILKTRFISNEEVKYYFCASEIVVQPYKSATQSGIAQIAIHFCKPAIVTKVGGLHEIVLHEKTGYTVEPIASEIAHAIKMYFQNPDKVKMEEAVSREKSRYSWKHMAEGVLV